VTRIAIKDLLGRKLRLVLTSLAIVMGVAMVSGTYVLTDTIDAAFNTIFATAYSGSDAVVTGKVAFGQQAGAPSFPQSTLARVEALPGVAAAAGGVSDTAQYVGRDGKVLSLGGAPGLAFSHDRAADQRFNPLTLLRGAWPVGPHEVAVDTTTASHLHVGVGGTVSVLPRGGRELRLRVSGIAEFGRSTTLGGATLAIFDLSTAQSLFHKQGQLDQIDVAARPGTASAALLAQIRSVLPPQTQVRTGQQQAQQSSSDTSSALSFLRYFLLAFGGIALFVGAFVITNTMTITIAQQTREFATLRSMGALRRQIVAVVVVEGAVTGLCASAIGLFVGLGLAKGLDAVFRAFGADLPQAGLVFATRTVVVSLLVGIVVTLLASLRPALRATRVPPIAAVREGSILPPGRFARFGPAAAVGVCAVAGALAGYGAFADGLATGTRLPLLAAGVVGLFIGIAMLAPRVVRPIAGVLAWPASRVGGAAGSLARANAMRNPARTASTAAALMIGLALVTTVAVLAQGLRNSFEGAVTDAFRADYALTGQDSVTPTSIDSATALRRSGIATVVAGVRAGQGRAFGKTIAVSGVDPGISQMLRLKWKVGSDASLEGLGAHGAIVTKDFASSHHLAVGTPLRLETPGGKYLDLAVAAILSPPRGGSPLGVVTTSSAAFDAVYPNPQNVFAFALVPGGVTPANTRRLTAALSAYPNAKIQTEQEFIKNEEKGLDVFLNLLFILLGLSIVVSLFGIVNTLVLTVFERTREIGLLRAVGMTRRQSRRMIRYEAVVTALIGATLGIPIGMGLAELFGQAIGGVPFAVPWGTVLEFVIAAVVVGLIAAIFPARRASRLDVLAALQYE
jgi:putative ABC transport system permease protein